MNRFIKYSKDYKLAFVCLAITIAASVWVAATTIALFASPLSSSVFGLDRLIATSTLFFVPTVAGVALMLGMNFWFTAESKRIGLYGLPKHKW